MTIKKIGDDLHSSITYKQSLTGMGIGLRGEQCFSGCLGRFWSGKYCAAKDGVWMLFKKTSIYRIIFEYYINPFAKLGLSNNI